MKDGDLAEEELPAIWAMPMTRAATITYLMTPFAADHAATKLSCLSMGSVLTATGLRMEYQVQTMTMKSGEPMKPSEAERCSAHFPNSGQCRAWTNLTRVLIDPPARKENSMLELPDLVILLCKKHFKLRLDTQRKEQG